VNKVVNLMPGNALLQEMIVRSNYRSPTRDLALLLP
jgi:hypothetical protein